ncbi:glycosyltransferase family 4 protein [Acinetobacter indicus]|uniref:glycosyltransferase family 4 protein n=1 Tax=Acinetobacter indicus TaxID=756892 RepID=UPI00136374F3|nr:glycosyltransferase family 4 protein [Acinetobacter indicus]
MKVLLLSPLPPPVGGIATWTMNIIKYYELKDKKESDINIIHQNTAIRFRNITKLSFFSRVISGVQDGIRTFIIFFYYLLKYRPDVIHLTSSGSLGLWKDVLFVYIAKLFNIPLTIHFRFGRIPEISKLNNWEWKILQKVVSLSSSAIVLDDTSEHTLTGQGFKHIYTIPNPISDSVENVMNTQEDGIWNDKRVYRNILFVGHVTKNKGIFELVQSFSLLSNVDELILIGPFELEVKNQIIELAGIKSDKITFTGALDKVEVLNAMKRATVLVLPSYTEGFPNVIIEAMAMQCPIVATKVGAVASMLNDGCSNPAGLIVEPKNVEALTESLDFIISNPEQAKIFAHNAYLKVKSEYTLETVCHQYEKIWTNCVNREI